MPPVFAAIGAIGGAVGGAISGAVGAIGSFSIGGIAVGQAALQLGASLALSAIADALSPRASAGAGAGQIELRGRTISARVPISPREIVYGSVRKGGVIVFLHSTGGSDEFLHVVIVLAAHRIQSIGTVYFDGIPAIDGNGVALGRWAESVDTVEKALGGQTSNPFPALSQQTAGLWSSAHVLRGCAAISMRLRFNPDAFPAGIPAISFDMQGKNDVLDPRTGVRGYTDNAALCVSDYMSLADYGIGAAIGSETGIDSAALIAAANICDETVAIAGGSEKRYTCNGVISLSQSPRAIIQSMLTAMSGQVVYRAARWFVLAGAYRAPVVSFGPGDFDEKSFAMQTRVSMRENFNGVRGKFISPVNDWQPDDFPAYRSAVYVAEDNGEERWLDVSLPFTTSAAMAQRLAKIALEKNRRQMSVSFSGKLPLYRATAGDTVNFNFPAWEIANKPFAVQNVSFSGNGSDGARLKVVLRETSPLVYDWNASEEQIYAAAPRTDLPSAFAIAPPGTPTITEQLYVTRDGASVKALAAVSWTPAPSAFVAQYQLETRQNSGPWVVRGRTPDTNFEILDIAPGVWQFRVKAISEIGVSSEYRQTTQEIFALSQPPAQLQNVSLQTAGGLAILTWTRPSDLDVRIGGQIVIRHSISSPATWPNSVSMSTVAGAEGIAVLPLKPGTYIIRAQDSSGVYGPATFLATSGAQALAFSPLDFLQADPVFSGAKENVGVINGGLALVGTLLIDDWPNIDEVGPIDYVGGIQPSGVYTFSAGLDFGAVSLVRLRSEIVMEPLAIEDLIDARLNTIDEWLDFDGTSGAETDCYVEARFTNDDPTGSPAWSPWLRVDSSEIQARAVQSRAILTTSDFNFTPLVSQLRLYAEEVA
jgi:hypothetical protein